jgi:hypothetical protein
MRILSLAQFVPTVFNIFKLQKDKSVNVASYVANDAEMQLWEYGRDRSQLG